MALKTNYSAANRRITNALQITYEIEQVVTTQATEGVGAKPDYVTAAEQAIADVNEQIADVEEELPEQQQSVAEFKEAEQEAYAAWEIAQDYETYSAYVAAKNDFNNAQSRYQSMLNSLSNYRGMLPNLNNQLNLANRKWAANTSQLTIVNDKIIGFRYKRKATGSYKYFGMTKTAAESCAAAMQTYYTRNISKSSEFSAGGQITDLYSTYNPSAIQISHAYGDAWEVTISINEEDVHSGYLVVAPASKFTTENQRLYEI